MHYNRFIRSRSWYNGPYSTLWVAKKHGDAVQGVHISHIVAVISHYGRQPQVGCGSFSYFTLELSGNTPSRLLPFSPSPMC